MALHGGINVNQELIGWWTATRKEDTCPPHEVYRYECTVLINGDKHEFDVVHAYVDGALALAAAVLARAHRGPGDTTQPEGSE